MDYESSAKVYKNRGRDSRGKNSLRGGPWEHAKMKSNDENGSLSWRGTISGPDKEAIIKPAGRGWLSFQLSPILFLIPPSSDCEDHLFNTEEPEARALLLNRF